jgi:integrase
MARLYSRADRWWGDFREFAQVGGAREPLIPPGQSRATPERNLAAQLFAARLRELEAARDNVSRGRAPEMRLGDFSREHLAAKREAGQVTPEWLEAQAVFLERAVSFFGEACRLERLDVEQLERWIAVLRLQHAKGKARPLSEGSVRHHLNALSNLYRRAQSRHLVPPGFNPVAALMEKPAGKANEAAWLEVPDAALLLESAKRLPRLSIPNVLPFLPELLATLLLTGGRLSEVLGLEVEDVSLDRHTIAFRPNQWRRLKTRGSARTVPLWPQLEELLRPYLDRRTTAEVMEDAPARRLLFPAPFRGSERMLGDIQKSLDRAAIQAGFREPIMEGEAQRRDAKDRLLWRGTIRSKMFRHSYAAARLQTLDQGAPVSIYTVAQELGHDSETMVKRIYGHLGTIRHRAEVVEYRIEQHQEAKLKSGQTVAAQLAAFTAETGP